MPKDLTGYMINKLCIGIIMLIGLESLNTLAMTDSSRPKSPGTPESKPQCERTLHDSTARSSKHTEVLDETLNSDAAKLFLLHQERMQARTRSADSRNAQSPLLAHQNEAAEHITQDLVSYLSQTLSLQGFQFKIHPTSAPDLTSTQGMISRILALEGEIKKGREIYHRQLMAGETISETSKTNEFIRHAEKALAVFSLEHQHQQAFQDASKTIEDARKLGPSFIRELDARMKLFSIPHIEILSFPKGFLADVEQESLLAQSLRNKHHTRIVIPIELSGRIRTMAQLAHEHGSWIFAYPNSILNDSEFRMKTMIFILHEAIHAVYESRRLRGRENDLDIHLYRVNGAELLGVRVPNYAEGFSFEEVHTYAKQVQILRSRFFENRFPLSERRDLLQFSIHMSQQLRYTTLASLEAAESAIKMKARVRITHELNGRYSAKVEINIRGAQRVLAFQFLGLPPRSPDEIARKIQERIQAARERILQFASLVNTLNSSRTSGH